MTKKRAYVDALVGSIRNSGMWLKEAKLLASKGSKGHAQALVIFSDEEIGKALMCWMTINGVFPYNHWEVDFRGRNSMFRSHRLKNATAMGLTLALLFPDENLVEDETCTDPWTGDRVGLRELLAKVGAFVTWARSRWMYVDIEEKEGSLNVASPLNMEPHSVDEAIEQSEYCLSAFKKIVRESHEDPDDFRDLLKDLRDALIERDKEFSEIPEWE